MTKAKDDKKKTGKPPAKKERVIVVDIIEKAESTVIEEADPLSINTMVGDADDGSGQQEALLEQLPDIEINMPSYPHGVIKKARGLFSRNGHEQKVMARAVILHHTPRYVDYDALLPLEDLQAADILPARYKNGWVYPVIVDQEGNYSNCPRQQNIALGASSYILWLARNWPEHKVLNRTEKNWWQKATGYGIIVVVLLIILVVFMLLFFFITS